MPGHPGDAEMPEESDDARDSAEGDAPVEAHEPAAPDAEDSDASVRKA